MNAVAVRDESASTSYAEPGGLPEAARALVLWAESAGAAYELSRRLVTTAFCPAQYKGKPDEAAAAMLAGAEVGLSPMAALRAFDIIQGVAAPRAITLRAIVQAQGHDIIIEESTAQRAAGRGRRRGTREWQPYEFTISMARELGLLSKDQWKKQPATMLVARFTSGICRLIAADAILGIPYSLEELADETTAEPPPPAAPPPTTRVSRNRKPAEPPPVTEPDLLPPGLPDEPGVVDVHLPDEPPITNAQMKHLQALFGDLGLTNNDREEKLAMVADVIGHEVASAKDLTMQQASAVIDELKTRVENLDA